MIRKQDVYDLGPKTIVWLEAVGIDTLDKLVSKTPEEIYETLLKAKRDGDVRVKNLAKPMLYALRANAHYLKTGEKVPFQFWRKIGD